MLLSGSFVTSEMHSRRLFTETGAGYTPVGRFQGLQVTFRPSDSYRFSTEEFQTPLPCVKIMSPKVT